MEIRELNKKKLLFFSEIYKQIPTGMKKKKICSYQDDYNYRAHKKNHFFVINVINFWFGIFHDSLSV